MQNRLKYTNFKPQAANDNKARRWGHRQKIRQNMPVNSARHSSQDVRQSYDTQPSKAVSFAMIAIGFTLTCLIALTFMIVMG